MTCVLVVVFCAEDVELLDHLMTEEEVDVLMAERQPSFVPLGEAQQGGCWWMGRFKSIFTFQGGEAN
jgi:hypothetical protein